MHLRTMAEQDIAAGLRLNTLAGWNQSAADWLHFIRASPCGCFVAEADGHVVGTVATIAYENRFAWIGMVLVDPDYRRQGVGTRLLQKAIEYLDRANVACMKLDATSQGQPLYEKLGFVCEYEIERWILRRPSPAAVVHARTARAALTDGGLVSILTADREVFGADRGFLLRSLFHEWPEAALAVRAKDIPLGYSLGRRGLFADHLGPWMAQNREVADKLLQDFLAVSARETLIVDCLKANPYAAELLRATGFVFSRPLTRMVRGPNTFPGNPSLLCAILGPEFG